MPAWHQLSLHPPEPGTPLAGSTTALKTRLPSTGNQRGDTVRRARGKKRRNVQLCSPGERGIFNKHSINCQQDLVAFFIACKMLRELQTALGGSLAAPRPSVRCCVQIKSSTRAALPRQIPPGLHPAPTPPHPPSTPTSLGSGLVPPAGDVGGPAAARPQSAPGQGSGNANSLCNKAALFAQRETPRPPASWPGWEPGRCHRDIISTITVSNHGVSFLLTRLKSEWKSETHPSAIRASREGCGSCQTPHPLLPGPARAKLTDQPWLWGISELQEEAETYQTSAI